MERFRFATAFSCIAGEIFEIVLTFMRKEYDVHYVDFITEPGINRVLANSHDIPPVLLRRFKKNMEVSVKTKGSRIVAIVGREGCLENPYGRAIQIQHLKESERTVKSFGCEGIERIPLLWIPHNKIIEVV